MARRKITNGKDIGNNFGSQDFLMNNPSVLKVMRDEIQRLEREMRKRIELHYDNYTPKKYRRTYDWRKSVRISSPYRTGDGRYAMKIYFNDDQAWHPSSTKNRHEEGYVPWLMEVGWDISRHTGQYRYMFDYFGGTRYVRESIKAVLKTTKYDIEINAYLNGELVYKNGRQVKSFPR